MSSRCMKKFLAGAAGAGILVTGLLGCYQTTSQMTVTEKKQNEAQGGAQSQNAAEEKGQNTSTVEGQVQAPERYQASFETNEGMFRVEADADIRVPEAEKMEIRPVKSGNISQEDLDRVTGVLFQGQPLMQYQDEKQAGEMTQEECERYIRQLEALRDKVDSGVRERLDTEIEAYRKRGEKAPASVKMKEIPIKVPEPADGASLEGFVTIGEKEYEFQMITVNDEGEVLQKIGFYDRTARCAQYFTESRVSEQEGDFSMETPSETIIGEGNALLEQLGYEGFALAQLEYQKAASPYLEEKDAETGLVLHYTREIDQIPILYYREAGKYATSLTLREDRKSDGGIGLGEGNSPIQKIWQPEEISILYTDEGLRRVLIKNLYIVEAGAGEAVYLLPFQEITDVFQRMIGEKYKSYQEQNIKASAQVQQIKLGYVRTAEDADDQEGRLVPAWIFYGNMETVYPEEGEYLLSQASFHSAAQALLIINAMDGTVIDAP